MKFVLTPDKTRFLHVGAEQDQHYVHTVEFSDDRSHKQFFTLWLKRNDDETRAWAATHGLDPENHNPDLYHRDDKSFTWIISEFNDSIHFGHWRTHYHVLTDGPPRAVFLIPFLDQIPAALFAEIQDA